MKNIQLTLGLALLFAIAACNKTDKPNDPDPAYLIGKNRFTTQLNDDSREYYVHVPTGYTGKSATPVVFMLHGTSGDGEEFYNHSGWKEVGESDNILTVFPSSWRHCIIDEDGDKKTTTKWNSQPTTWDYCAGEVPRDDIQFFRNIVSEIKTKFNVDSKRIYLVGFSNGGQMAAKCAILMGDVFAAIVESAGSLSVDSNYNPVRKMPVTYQVGNEDYGPGNVGPAVPLSLMDTLISTPGLTYQNGKAYRVAQAHVKSFGLNPNYTISGDTNSISIATYISATPNPLNSFRYVLVKGLAHAYPNGDNHPAEAAELNWAWLKNYSLP